MARLSEEKIAQIKDLYPKIKTFSGVAKIVGCAPSTVKRYAEIADCQNFDKSATPFEGPVLPIEKVRLIGGYELGPQLRQLSYFEKEQIVMFQKGLI